MKIFVFIFFFIAFFAIHGHTQTAALTVINSTSDNLAVTGVVALSCSTNVANSATVVIPAGATALIQPVFPMSPHDWVGLFGVGFPSTYVTPTFSSQNPTPSCPFIVPTNGSYMYNWTAFSVEITD